MGTIWRPAEFEAVDKADSHPRQAYSGGCFFLGHTARKAIWRIDAILFVHTRYAVYVHGGIDNVSRETWI